MKIKNLTKVFAFFILAFLSLINVAGFGSAVTIFSDGFEYASLTDNGWTLGGTGRPWTIGNNFNNGAKNAEVMPDGTSFMQKKYSTLGYENIKVTFFKLTGEDGGSFGDGDTLNVTWSSSGNSNTFKLGVSSSSNDLAYNELSFTVPSEAWNNPNFTLRFECITNNANEFCRVDDIKIEGTPISLSINPETKTLRFGERNTTIEVINNGDTSLTVDMSEITSFGAKFSPDPFTLNSRLTQTVTVLLDALQNIKFGENLITIKADAGNGITDTATINVQRGFCEFGPKGGNLSISRFDINVVEGGGKDNNWQLLDTVEVTFEVRNSNNRNDIEDVFVELALFDENGNDQAGDLIFESDDEKIDLGDIDSGDKERASFKFRVPADLDTSQKYLLAVKAYSDDLGEEVECTDTFGGKLFERISVDTIDDDDEGKFIAFENIRVSPSDATCGEAVSLTADVFNIGDNKQERVRVNLVNAELGINQFYEIKSEMETGDKRTAYFTFNLPQGLKNKIYQLKLSADYEYDKGDYEQSSDDDTLVPLKVVGCTESGGNYQFVSINAALDSEAKAGAPLIVKAALTNTGSSTATFIVGARGYESWASLNKISQRIVAIPAGQTAEITFLFNVNEDVKGEKSFFIQVNDEAGNVQEREVAVNIQQKSGIGGFSFGEGNSLIWVIGIVNVILIILIIIVAIRISRR